MKTWTVEEIRDLLAKSDVFLERSLIKMYNRQTPTEQFSHYTIEENGIGFNAFDATFLCSVSEQVMNSSFPEGMRMTNKQKEAVRRCMKKYAAQITSIANCNDP